MAMHYEEDGVSYPGNKMGHRQYGKPMFFLHRKDARQRKGERDRRNQSDATQRVLVPPQKALFSTSPRKDTKSPLGNRPLRPIKGLIKFASQYAPPCWQRFVWSVMFVTDMLTVEQELDSPRKRLKIDERVITSTPSPSSPASRGESSDLGAMNNFFSSARGTSTRGSPLRSVVSRGSESRLPVRGLENRSPARLEFRARDSPVVVKTLQWDLDQLSPDEDFW